jgi:hypothetical protein
LHFLASSENEALPVSNAVQNFLAALQTFSTALQNVCNTSFGDPRPAKWVKIPPEINGKRRWQVIAAVHGDIKG